MKKLSEYRNREALDKLAEIIGPLSDLMSHPEFSNNWTGKNRWKAISYAAKNYPDTCMELLAAMEGVPVEELDIGVMTFPIRLMEVFSEEVIGTAFLSQKKGKTQSTSSGAATENTEEKEA